MLSVQPQQTTTPPATPLTIPHATPLFSPHELRKPSHIQTCAHACVRSRATHAPHRSGCHCRVHFSTRKMEGKRPPKTGSRGWVSGEPQAGNRRTAIRQNWMSHTGRMTGQHHHPPPNAFASRFHPAPKTPNSQGKQDRMLPSITPPATLLTLPHTTLLSSPHELRKPSHIQTCARACVRSRATHSKARSGCHCPQPPVGLNTVTVQFHIPTDFEGGAECISAPGRWKGKGHRRLGAESG
jgi:hypothetical protein